MNIPTLRGFDMDEIIKKYEELLRCYYPGTKEERLERIISTFKNKATDTIRSADRFKVDCLNYLRAMHLVVESVLAAYTHKEKDARIRGLIDLMKTAIDQVGRREINDLTDWYPRAFSSGVFDPSYEYDRLREKCNRLEGQLEYFKGNAHRKEMETLGLKMAELEDAEVPF